ncbi:hypothetical protein Patl1_22216 [Pistacia atlantica]|uniref:Uncharacterized protein n=1 Tax=Pistacia atlantica TaxID=434234 RepID=A0ACC1BJT3_9ROSI|nr:hypothetical protein Patl1_22216 [Pistacia atlantica]
MVMKLKFPINFTIYINFLCCLVAISNIFREKKKKNNNNEDHQTFSVFLLLLHYVIIR